MKHFKPLPELVNHPCADGGPVAPLVPYRPRYCCAGCKTPTRLSDLDDDMLCEACGEPSEEPDNCEPTADELWAAERTWSV